MRPSPAATSSERPGHSPEQLALDASRRLRLGYTLALSLIAALTLGSHVLTGSMLATNGLDAVTINLAGRQRMLAQRISKEAVLAGAGVRDTAARATARFDADLLTLQTVQAALRDGSAELGVAGPGREIAGPAFDAVAAAYERLHAAAVAVRAELDAGPSTASLPRLLEAEAAYLPLMDRLVETYQKWSNAKLDRTGKVHLLLGVALLGVLLLEAVFLFRPAIQRIRRQMLELAIAQERTQLLAMAAEHTRHAVLLGEADGAIAWVNAAGEGAFRACRADIPRLSDAAPSQVAARVQAAVDAGDDLHLDDVSGDETNTALDLVAVRDAEGRARRYVLVMTDLSERARREQELRDVQRRAGRADVAVTILHNVGNTLNSLALAASSASSGLRESRLPGLARALEMLDTDPEVAAAALLREPRAAKLPAYLHELCRRLHEEQAQLDADLTTVQAGVDHLRHVVSTENQAANRTASDRDAALEEVEARALVAEAVRVYGGSATVHRIAIDVSEADDRTLLRVDRHAAMQVLGNLLTNAVRAVRMNREHAGRRTARRRSASRPDAPGASASSRSPTPASASTPRRSRGSSPPVTAPSPAATASGCTPRPTRRRPWAAG